jgi:hypothetical protein
MTMTKYGKAISKTEELKPAELAVLNFLRSHPETKYSTEDVGRQVRPLVMTKVSREVNDETAPICDDPRIIRNWANTILNTLHRKSLVCKEGTRGRSLPVHWWVSQPQS